MKDRKSVSTKFVADLSWFTSQFQDQAYPGHLTGVFLRAVGNLTQNEVRPVEHLTFVSKRWSASQKKGFRSTFSMYTVFKGHCSYMYIDLLEHLRAFEKARGLAVMNNLIETNKPPRHKTAFQDFVRYFCYL